jgi:hypothetical protein
MKVDPAASLRGQHTEQNTITEYMIFEFTAYTATLIALSVTFWELVLISHILHLLSELSSDGSSSTFGGCSIVEGSISISPGYDRRSRLAA